jgi:hypothetical protein
MGFSLPKVIGPGVGDEMHSCASPGMPVEPTLYLDLAVCRHPGKEQVRGGCGCKLGHGHDFGGR